MADNADKPRKQPGQKCTGCMCYTCGLLTMTVCHQSGGQITAECSQCGASFSLQCQGCSDRGVNMYDVVHITEGD